MKTFKQLPNEIDLVDTGGDPLFWDVATDCLVHSWNLAVAAQAIGQNQGELTKYHGDLY